MALTGGNAYVRWSRRSAGPFQAAFGLDEADDAVEPLALLEVGHDERPLAAHAPGVRLHLFQGCADMGRQVDLVDDKEVGPGDAGAALRRDLVAGRHVDDVNGDVGELRGKSGSEIITAGFDQYE